MKVLSFGEILWDIVEGEEFLGGAPFNFAAHAARCGNEAFVISRVGNDRLGKKAVDLSGTYNVGSSFIQVDRTHATGVVDVSLTDGQPAYSIREDVAYDHIDARAIAGLDEMDFDVLYFGSLAQRATGSASALAWIIGNHNFPVVFYDVNIRRSLDLETILKRSLPWCNIVKMNAEEAPVVGGALGITDVSPGNVCRRIVGTYPDIDIVIVTAAEKGCVVYAGGALYAIAGVPVVVEDAIGAGDAFSAAFMNEYFRTEDPVRSATIANRVGAYVASRRGPIPEYTEEIMQLCGAAAR